MTQMEVLDDGEPGSAVLALSEGLAVAAATGEQHKFDQYLKHLQEGTGQHAPGTFFHRLPGIEDILHRESCLTVTFL